MSVTEDIWLTADIKDVSDVKILVIQKGFGSAFKKLEMIRAVFSKDNIIEAADFPEPSEDLKSGADMLDALIAELRPDLVIASSRAGSFVAEVLERHCDSDERTALSQCAFLLMSAMGSRKAAASTHPLLLCHGGLDKTNSIDAVKADCAAFPTARLISVESDSHSLESLFVDESILPDLCIRALRWFAYANCRKDKLMKSADSAKGKAIKTRMALFSAITKPTK
eukprot:m.258919 g.258919  ORF g.258919 m.258919 type:complete len:225 (-) comp37280_c0_seq1:153-827(-)